MTFVKEWFYVSMQKQMCHRRSAKLHSLTKTLVLALASGVLAMCAMWFGLSAFLSCQYFIFCSFTYTKVSILIQQAVFYTLGGNIVIRQYQNSTLIIFMCKYEIPRNFA